MADQNAKATAPAHTAGTRKGEEMKGEEGKEAGRHEAGTTHADRPAGKATARDSTSINPDDRESSTGGPKLPPS
jgi:hypothetical protein